MNISPAAIFLGAVLTFGMVGCGDGGGTPSASQAGAEQSEERSQAAEPTRVVGAPKVLATPTPEGALSPGTWSSTGDMAVGRIDHRATLLDGGRVLATGGKSCPAGGGDTGKCRDADSALASAELWDPATGVWSATSGMQDARYTHSSILLNDGRVLLAGGDGTEAELASVELYDPSADTWTSAGSLESPRSFSGVALLHDGRVLIVGGGTAEAADATSEVYDPVSGSWSSAGSMTVARQSHTTTLLPDGRVLVTGGFGGVRYHATAEIYDPDEDTWTQISDLSVERYDHTATLLQDGRVLLTGGRPSPFAGRLALSSAQLYNPGTDTWSEPFEMVDKRTAHTALLLEDGRPLVIGGGPRRNFPTNLVWTYDPTDNDWSPVQSMASPRERHASTLLGDGRALVTGGRELRDTSFYYRSAEVFDPSS